MPSETPRPGGRVPALRAATAAIAVACKHKGTCGACVFAFRVQASGMVDGQDVMPKQRHEFCTCTLHYTHRHTRSLRPGYMALGCLSSEGNVPSWMPKECKRVGETRQASGVGEPEHPEQGHANRARHLRGVQKQDFVLLFCMSVSLQHLLRARPQHTFRKHQSFKDDLVNLSHFTVT